VITRKSMVVLAAIVFSLVASGGIPLPVVAQEPPQGEAARVDVERTDVLDETRRIIRPQFTRTLGEDSGEVMTAIDEEAPEFLRAQLGLPPTFVLKRKSGGRIGANWIVDYSLSFQGIPFSDATSATLLVRAAEDASASVRSRNLPRGGVEGTSPTVLPERAVAFATERFLEVTALPISQAMTTTEPTLVFEADDSAVATGRLCWSVTISTEVGERTHKYRFSVAAQGEPRVVREQSLVQFDYRGKVLGPFWPSTPVAPTGAMAPAVVGALPSLKVLSLAGESLTNSDGSYQIAGLPGPTTVSARLEGESFVIENMSTSVAQSIASADGSDGADIDLLFAQSKEEEIAQSSAYYWANQARRFAAAILAADQLRPTKVLVNVDSTCNASFTAPDTIRLYRSGPDPANPAQTCVNRAYADTIFHEFGHAVDYVLGGIASGSYSEGFGDSLAILNSRSSCYGRDTRGPGTCLRRADNAFTWPGANLEAHTKGQIYSGFVWELVAGLQSAGVSADESYAITRDLVLGAAMLNPTNIQAAVAMSIEVDDDDGDVSNGTPHLTAIRAAAKKKGLWKDEWDPAP
jgi:hypothetical protein